MTTENSNPETTTENTETTNAAEPTAPKLSAIDKAIAMAKLRQAAKAQANGNVAAKDSQSAETVPAPKVKKEKVVKTNEDKATTKADRENTKAQREAQRAADKAARDVARALKKADRAEVKATKNADKPQAHMSKVEKAGAKLPQMDNKTEGTFDTVCRSNLNEGQITVLIAHLAHMNRVRQTVNSHSVKLVEGQLVEIMSSDRDARLIGMKGHITQVRKIRVLVDIGRKNPAYLFTSDVRPCADEVEILEVEAEPEVAEVAEQCEATGTDGV
jgi:hypothetical protein